MKSKKRIYILVFVVSLSALLYLSFKGYRERINAWRLLSDAIKKEATDFNGESGIIIKDLNNHWQVLHNQDKLFPSASLVKIPIMVSCFYAADNARLNLEEKLRLNSSHKTAGSGILKNMASGREFTVAELVELMVVHSDNTAANILIERLGFDYLNSSFKEMGLQDTNLSRRMMDFRERKKGIENYTTAYDIVYLLEKIYHGGIISSTASKKCLELLKAQKIRDRIPAKLPRDSVVAHKTGLERGVCHDAGIVFTESGDFLICILTRHNHRISKPAKNFIAQIAFLAYNYYNHESQ